jgi:hypothetical protein
MRKFKDRYSVWMLNQDSMMFEYILEIIILAVYASQNPIESKYWLFGILTGFCFYSGKQTMGQSVVRGYAGPAQSLSATMVIYSTILTTFVGG